MRQNLRFEKDYHIREREIFKYVSNSQKGSLQQSSVAIVWKPRPMRPKTYWNPYGNLSNN